MVSVAGGDGGEDVSSSEPVHHPASRSVSWTVRLLALRGPGPEWCARPVRAESAAQ